jgi:Flp pilus assembly protein TadG
MTMRARLSGGLARGLAAVLRDRRGAALIEFAIIMPVMLMLIMGTMEFGVNIYVRAVLEGAIQQAGRNTSLESGSTNLTTIHTNLESRVKAILPGATVTPTRKNYSSFIAASTPEQRYDSNSDGVLDSLDCFYDLNGNGLLDDGSKSGIGSANDVVMFTETVTYPTLIPAASALGISPTTSISATTLLRNQPYGTGGAWASTSVCP